MAAYKKALDARTNTLGRELQSEKDNPIATAMIGGRLKDMWGGFGDDMNRIESSGGLAPNLIRHPLAATGLPVDNILGKIAQMILAAKMVGLPENHPSLLSVIHAPAPTLEVSAHQGTYETGEPDLKVILCRLLRRTGDLAGMYSESGSHPVWNEAQNIIATGNNYYERLWEWVRGKHENHLLIGAMIPAGEEKRYYVAVLPDTPVPAG